MSSNSTSNHTWVSASTCECDVDVRKSSVDNGPPADRLAEALLCPRVHEPVLEYLLLEMILRFSILESQRVQYMQYMQGTDDI